MQEVAHVVTQLRSSLVCSVVRGFLVPHRFRQRSFLIYAPAQPPARLSSNSSYEMQICYNRSDSTPGSYSSREHDESGTRFAECCE